MWNLLNIYNGYVSNKRYRGGEEGEGGEGEEEGEGEGEEGEGEEEEEEEFFKESVLPQIT